MSKQLLISTLSLFLVVSAVVPRAAATTLARMSLADLSRAAGAIVRVRCVAVNSRSDRGIIWTFNDFVVLERFKGAPPDRIQVRVPGGHVGHLIATIEEAPRFQTGEESILFLENSAAGGYAITAWAEGTFRVVHQSLLQSGQQSSQQSGPQTVPQSAGATQTGDASATVTQDSNSFAVFDPATRRFRVEGIHKLSLGEFRRSLATALSQPAVAGSR